MFKGCPSWQWFYPYHYAPFAQDITSIEDLKITFSPGQPFKPYEQLMAVLPAARFVFLVYTSLKINRETASTIYQRSLVISWRIQAPRLSIFIQLTFHWTIMGRNLLGKVESPLYAFVSCMKLNHLAIALLPFIDEQRLLQAVSKIYPKLRPEDLDRNRLGNEFLFVSEQHPLYERVAKHFFTKNAALKVCK